MRKVVILSACLLIGIRMWAGDTCSFHPGSFASVETALLQYDSAKVGDYVVNIEAEAMPDSTKMVYYQVVRYAENGTDVIDTLLYECGQVDYNNWHTDSVVPTDSVGKFIVRRFAHDTVCQNSWIQSKGEWVYTVAEGMNVGSIENGAVESLCQPKDTLLKKSFTIHSIAEATCPGGVEYRWLRVARGSMDTVILEENTPALSLEYDTTELDLKDSVYIYYREVRDAAHPENGWFKSAGVALQVYSRANYHRLNIPVCGNCKATSYKFTLEVTGEVIAREWKAGDDTMYVRAPKIVVGTDTLYGCPDTTHVQCSAIVPPELQFDGVNHLCRDSGRAVFPLPIIKGVPDTFRIVWLDTLAEVMGREDTVGRMSGGKIVLKNIASLPKDRVYRIHIQLGNTSVNYAGKISPDSHCKDGKCNECMGPQYDSVMIQFDMNEFVHEKFGKILFVDNNAENGRPEEDGYDLSFVAYQWYRDGALIPSATGQYYQQNGELLEGSYYVEMTDQNGRKYCSCEVKMQKPMVSEVAEQNDGAKMVIRNQQVMILRDGQYYDMLGRAVK